MRDIERCKLPTKYKIKKSGDAMYRTGNTVNNTIKTLYDVKSIKMSNHYVVYLKLIL